MSLFCLNGELACFDFDPTKCTKSTETITAPLCMSAHTLCSETYTVCLCRSLLINMYNDRTLMQNNKWKMFCTLKPNEIGRINV